ncbi:MAG: DUF3618 domain-containing protein [Pseudonocardiaceae bacterium]
MARDPDSIQRDIEDARDALADSLDALSVRASPRRLIEGGKQSIRATLADPKIKYGLLAAGAILGLLLLRRLSWLPPAKSR